MKIIKTKIHFTDTVLGEAAEEDVVMLTFNPKSGMLYFGKASQEALKIKEGMVIKFLTADGNRLGFKTRDTISLENQQKWRTVSLNKTTGAFTPTVKRYLAKFKDFEEDGKYKCEVQLYLDTSHLNRGEKTYFIELTPQNFVKGKDKEEKIPYG